MIQLSIYFFTIILLALGAFGFILAMRIEGKIRSFLASCMALAVMAFAIFVFNSANLKPKDFGRWLRISKKEVASFMQDLKSGNKQRRQLMQEVQKELQK